MSDVPRITQDPRHVIAEDENGREAIDVKYQVTAYTAKQAKLVNGVPRRGWLYRDERGGTRSRFLLALRFNTRALVAPRPNKLGLFEVTVGFGLPSDSNDGGGGKEPEPGQGHIDYWSIGTAQEPTDLDVNGDPLVDGLGNAFEPVPSYVTNIRLTSRIALESFDPTPYINMMLQNNGRPPANDAPFRGSSEGTAVWLGWQNNPRQDGIQDVAFNFDFKTNIDIVTLLDHDGALKLNFTMLNRDDFSKLPVAGEPSESILLNL